MALSPTAGYREPCAGGSGKYNFKTAETLSVRYRDYAQGVGSAITQSQGEDQPVPDEFLNSFIPSGFFIADKCNGYRKRGISRLTIKVHMH